MWESLVTLSYLEGTYTITNEYATINVFSNFVILEEPYTSNACIYPLFTKVFNESFLRMFTLRLLNQPFYAHHKCNKK